MWFLLSLFLDLNKTTRNGPVSGFTLLGLKWLDIGITLQHDSGMSIDGSRLIMDLSSKDQFNLIRHRSVSTQPPVVGSHTSI